MVDEIKENEEKESMVSQNEEMLNNDNSADDKEKKNSNNENEMNKDNNNGSNKNKNADCIEDENNDSSEKKMEEDELSTVELLKNIAKLEETITRLEAEKEAFNNRLQRLQADFSNYRKRTDKEMGKIQSTAVVELIRELLPVIDNFERALSQGESEDDFKKGVEMIFRQLMTFLEKQGVEVIDAVGEEFDHNYHNAVMQVESEEFDSGIIIEELQKGYILGEIVIRPAMVKVAE